MTVVFGVLSTTGLFSQTWILLGIITCLYIAFPLVRNILELMICVLNLYEGLLMNDYVCTNRFHEPRPPAFEATCDDTGSRYQVAEHRFPLSGRGVEIHVHR
ncbi:MAG: hypothetical protein WCD76_14105 [Pyrinomonadaceae bacterium]